MTQSPYIGIENEFEVFDKYSTKIDFKDYFGRLLRRYDKPFFKRTDYAIRTIVGNSIYADGAEAEINTPPVKIQKGFSTDLVDDLYLSKKELFDFIGNSDLDLIGYSTHTNISNSLPHNVSEAKYMGALAVPLSLFGITPLSIGIMLHSKDDKKRHELRTDFIGDEDQMRAFLNLFVGSFIGFHQDSKFSPLTIGDISPIPNLIMDGRYSKVSCFFNGEGKSIFAQDYLEIIYNHFKPYIEHFATEEEMKNLDDFINMKKPLEVDKLKFYTYQRLFKPKNTPSMKHDPRFVLSKDHFKEEREVKGDVARFLARCALPSLGIDRHNYEIESLTWSSLKIATQNAQFNIEGFDNLGALEKILSSGDSNMTSPRTFEAMHQLTQLTEAGIRRLSDTQDTIPFERSLLEQFLQSRNPLELPYFDLKRNSSDLSDLVKKLRTNKFQNGYDLERDHSLNDAENTFQEAFKRGLGTMGNTKNQIIDAEMNLIFLTRSLDENRSTFKNYLMCLGRYVKKNTMKLLLVYAISAVVGLGLGLGFHKIYGNTIKSKINSEYIQLKDSGN